jgi:hypothetical protein
MLYSGLSPFLYFVSVATYHENTVLHRYVDGNGSSSFTAIFEICGNSAFMPVQKLDEHVCMYLSNLCLLNCQLIPIVLLIILSL